MICINCFKKMEIEEGRTDNPYVDCDSYLCECGYGCERTFYGAGSDEPSSEEWFNDEGEYVDWKVEYERS